MDEMWDVYDEDRNKTGECVWRSAFPENSSQYHLAVHIWIKSSDNKWLISRRTPNKHFPLLWECTGGSALAGENSLAAALREVKEELGIDLHADEGFLYKSFQRRAYQDFCDVWVFVHDCMIEDIVLQPDETCDAMWASSDEIKHMMRDGVFIPLDNMKYVYELLGLEEY